MKRERVRALLEEVATGRATIDAALARLDDEPIGTLPFANIDHHRALRQGFPEVVFGEGKTVEQTVAICERLESGGDGFLVTRTNEAQRDALVRRFPAASANAIARTVHLAGRASAGGARAAATKTVLIVTAGTGDLPVAEEAAVTLAALGLGVERLSVVFVCGLYVLLSH
jgi:NCAIR mutase (PurE)-related protein